MYKIIMDPRRGKFVVKLLSWGVFWVTIKRETTNNKSVDQTFDTYQDAASFVDATGLKNIYRDYYQSTSYNVMSGGRA